MFIYFQKIVPIDERFLLLVGGTMPTSQKKPSILDLADNEPESSLYLLGIERPKYRVIAKKQLSHYSLHAAAALWNKSELFLVGGLQEGKWGKRCFSMMINQSFSSPT
jgi:hypothetical protein